MTPVIRIDDEVMDELKKRAIDLGLVFEPPNATLRRVLGFDSKAVIQKVVVGEIELELNASSRKYVYIPLPKDKRHFFPGFKVSFELITDVETVTAHVTSEPHGASMDVGNPYAGTHIRGKLGPWYARHPELKAGDRLRVEALEPGKRYKLSTIQSVTMSGQKAIADKIVKEALERYKEKN